MNELFFWGVDQIGNTIKINYSLCTDVYRCVQVVFVASECVESWSSGLVWVGSVCQFLACLAGVYIQLNCVHGVVHGEWERKEPTFRGSWRLKLDVPSFDTSDPPPLSTTTPNKLEV